MMRNLTLSLLAATPAALLCALSAGAAKQPQTPAAGAAQPVVYLGHEKVAAAFVKGGAMNEGDHYKVMAGRHDGPGGAEVHTVDTDVFYVLEGTATFITGGTVKDSHSTGANEVRGSAIEGGQTHHLQKGDVIIIPKGVPHWFQETTPGFLYFVVKAH